MRAKALEENSCLLSVDSYDCFSFVQTYVNATKHLIFFATSVARNSFAVVEVLDATVSGDANSKDAIIPPFVVTALTVLPDDDNSWLAPWAFRFEI